MRLLAALFRERSQETLVVLTQVYVPDPASLGQHMHDASAELVRRGLRVVVFTADRGYQDPAQRYPRYELRDGVHVVRVPRASFGKRRMAVRLAGAGMFLVQATSLALLLRRVDRVLVSTSPPMCGLGGLALSTLRSVPLTYWVMDLNPDQIVAMGALSATAPPVLALDALNRRVLRRASRVVALDRFMAERLGSKHDVFDKLSIIPPWPLVDAAGPSPLAAQPRAGTAFRRRHGIGDARVVMYSGNLSLVHPVTTLLEAARALRRDARLRFVFVGGGAGSAELERAKREHDLENVVILPYQPLALLAESLSAADVHLVSMGDAMVGIVHPCKLYGAMAVGRPILSLGPDHSHIADLVGTETLGWHVGHGDVDGMLRALREIAEADTALLDEIGRRAALVIGRRLSRDVLLGRFCDLFAASRLDCGPGDALPASE